MCVDKLDVLQQACTTSAALPSSETSGSVTEQNGHPPSIETENSSSCPPDIKEKSKKTKKHKTHGDDQTESSAKDVVQGDDSTATCDSLTKSETKKKKKKKKHREDVVSIELCENGKKSEVVADDSSYKAKKSTKKRKHNSDVQNADESRDVQSTNDYLCKRVKTTDGNIFSFHFTRTIFLENT